MSIINKAIKNICIFLIGAYFVIASVIFVPYYNWQYANENGFISWILLGEIIPSLKAIVWPYFVYSAYYERQKPVITAEAAKFNSSELDRFSKIMAKIMSGNMLSESDFQTFRDIISDVSKRTGRYLTQKDINLFTKVIQISMDYQYELGQSCLLSWDQKQYHTTKAFDELYNIMKETRKETLLKADLQTIVAASRNQQFVEDGNGNKFEYNREIIVNGMKKVDRVKDNLALLSGAMKEKIK